MREQDDRFVRALLGAGAAVVGLAVLITCAGALGCWFGGGAFVRFGIGTDLEDYERYVASSDLSAADRAEVEARLDLIRKQVRSGDLAVPFVVWVDIDDEVERLLDDGHVPPDELAALHDQLTRIESYRD